MHLIVLAQSRVRWMLWEEYAPRIHLRYVFVECVVIQQAAEIGKERPQSVVSRCFKMLELSKCTSCVCAYKRKATVKYLLSSVFR